MQRIYQAAPARLTILQRHPLLEKLLASASASLTELQQSDLLIKVRCPLFRLTQYLTDMIGMVIDVRVCR